MENQNIYGLYKTYIQYRNDEANLDSEQQIIRMIYQKTLTYHRT